MVHVLEFIEKDPKYYIAKYCSYDGTKFGIIIISFAVVEWFKSAAVGSKSNYDMTIGKNTTKVFVEKIANKKGNAYMKLSFNNDILYIPENKFPNIKYKKFCFQNFIERKIFNGNGQLEYHSYRFLGNYDIKNQALYDINKMGFKFAKMYKKYFMQDKILTDTSRVLEPFHENIIYEHEYLFRTEDNGVSSYIFSVITIERK